MKGYLLFSISLVLLLAVCTTGCGGELTAVAPDDLPSAGGDQSAEGRELQWTTGEATLREAPGEEATMTPLPTSEPAEVTPPPEAEAMVHMAVDDLTQHLSLAHEAIRLVSVEAMEWSDASLGCPQPGMMYAQVITPGYLVVLEAEGEQYTYHTDMDRFVVLCEEGGETSGGTGVESLPGESVTPDPLSPYYSLVIKAVEDLAGRLSVDVEEIGVLEVQEVVWPDSSLGCPLPGIAYKQVPEDGLLIRLEVEGQVYEYHSGGMRDPFLCEQPLTVKPPAIKLDLTKTIPPPRD